MEGWHLAPTHSFESQGKRAGKVNCQVPADAFTHGTGSGGEKAIALSYLSLRLRRITGALTS
jgi:hypothetical protein